LVETDRKITGITGRSGKAPATVSTETRHTGNDALLVEQDSSPLGHSLVHAGSPGFSSGEMSTTARSRASVHAVRTMLTGSDAKSAVFSE